MCMYAGQVLAGGHSIHLPREVALVPILLDRCFLFGAYISFDLEGRDRLSLLPHRVCTSSFTI